MGLPHPKLLLLLSHLAFLLALSSAQHPPAAAPAYHHHPHKPHPHHHHPAPAYSPAKPPTLPPVKPPTKPPAHPPVKPPVHPPVKPPTKPPVHPPVKPPTQPPVKPPTKPPTQPPVKPPAHPPVKPPTYPPVKPPTMPPVKPLPLPKKPVAVQGVVYCKNCSYFGVDTLLGSKALPGATVVLRCRTMKSVMVKQATTDKNGYFFIEAPKEVLPYKATRYCHVYLGAPAKNATCSHPTNINSGRAGALLLPQVSAAPPQYALFNVGPFAYQPPKRSCRKAATPH